MTAARDHFPAHTPEYIAAKKAEGHGMANLNDQVSQWASPWATPTVQDASNTAGPSQFDRNSHPLNVQVVLAAPWSTPRASDGEKGSPQQSFGAGGTPLPAQAASTAQWPTPQAGTPAQNGYNEAGGTDFSRKIDVIEGLRETVNGRRSGPMQNSGLAQTEKRGALAPGFVFWLMGFPIEWRNCVSEAMQSWRRSPRKSSPR